mgnify:CR=1 FL=1
MLNIYILNKKFLIHDNQSFLKSIFKITNNFFRIPITSAKQIIRISHTPKTTQQTQHPSKMQQFEILHYLQSLTYLKKQHHVNDLEKENLQPTHLF